jgi:hypothetical protein
MWDAPSGSGIVVDIALTAVGVHILVSAIAVFS